MEQYVDKMPCSSVALQWIREQTKERAWKIPPPPNLVIPYYLCLEYVATGGRIHWNIWMKLEYVDGLTTHIQCKYRAAP